MKILCQIIGKQKIFFFKRSKRHHIPKIVSKISINYLGFFLSDLKFYNIEQIGNVKTFVANQNFSVDDFIDINSFNFDGFDIINSI